MKKLIIASIAALSMSAFAGEYVGVTAGTSRVDGMTGFNTTGTVVVGTTFGNYDLSIKAGAARATNSTTSSTGNFAEVRGVYNFSDIAGAKPWVRASVGSEFGTGYANTYYSIEPGVGYAFTPAVRVDASLERVEYFDRSNKGRTDFNLLGTYAFTKNNDVTLQYTRVMSGAESNSIEVGLVHRF